MSKNWQILVGLLELLFFWKHISPVISLALAAQTGAALYKPAVWSLSVSHINILQEHVQICLQFCGVGKSFSQTLALLVRTLANEYEQKGFNSGTASWATVAMGSGKALVGESCAALGANLVLGAVDTLPAAHSSQNVNGSHGAFQAFRNTACDLGGEGAADFRKRLLSDVV